MQLRTYLNLFKNTIQKLFDILACPSMLHNMIALPQ